MSDIPAAAWWTLALALVMSSTGRFYPTLAGLAISMAVLTRPNLTPLAVVVAGYLWWARPDDNWRARAQRVSRLAVGIVPGIVVTALVQNALYGSPLSSGYGDLGALFTAEHVMPNLHRYPRWLVETHTPVVLLAWLAPMLVGRGRVVAGDTSAFTPVDPTRRIGWALLVFALVGIAAYVPYTVFDDWWYLRFLLPALPAILVLATFSLDRLASDLGHWGGPVVFSLVVLVVAVLGVRMASDRLAFRLWSGEQRFVTTGRAVDARLPPGAVVFSGFHSGNVRLNGHRPTVLWDALAPDWLDRAVESLTRQGREPYLVLDSWEEPLFRARFEAQSRLGALDWPPAIRVGNAVRIYAFADRDQYFAGGRVATETVPVGSLHGR